MGTPDVLRSSLWHTHQVLGDRLELARDIASTPSSPRAGQERIDVYLAAAGKHLHAVDAVLLPAIDRLSDTLDDSELDGLTEHLYGAEATAPTRPHPYVPHTGLPGRVARTVMHAADAFWDAAEGRMVPARQSRVARVPARVGSVLGRRAQPVPRPRP